MTWVYITLDIFLFALMGFLIYLLIRFWTKKKRMSHSPLSQFRNDDLYEKSLEDKKRLAHIEDAVNDQEYPDDLPIDDVIDEGIDNAEISFSDGYGQYRTREDYNDEN